MTEIQDLCIDILHHTHDGDDLSQCELKLVEGAVNGFLNGKGSRKILQIYDRVVTE